MEKVLVTGSCGFLGHHLVKELKKRGFYVIGVDNLSGSTDEYANFADLFWKVDCGDLEAEDLKGIKWVFHTAALPRVPYSIEFPLETNHANVTETLKLLMAARDAKVEKFIYSSSSSVYGDQKEFPTSEEAHVSPLSPYAVQKLAAEHYTEVFREVYNLPTVSLRYFNLYGEEQRADNPYTGVITKFIQMNHENKHLTIFGDGEQRRDFTYVGDVVEANLLTAEKGLGVYNVGTGTNTSVKEIAEIISDQELSYLPPRLGDPKLSLADNKKLLTLGWTSTVDLKQWLRENKTS